MTELVYAQIHTHSKYSVNKLSGEGVFHRYIWPLERLVLKSLMLSPESLAKEAKRKGISYLAVTDHNTVPHIEEYFSEFNTLIKGEEWGQKKGHASFISIERSIDPDCGYFKNIAPNNPKEFEVAVKEARDQGAFIIINHPFKSDSWLWGYNSYLLADAVEIWNGNWNEENAKALSLWQMLLENGLKLYATAANDFHVKRLYRIDAPLIVMHKTVNKIEFLQNLKDGKFSCAKDLRSPAVFLKKDGEMKYKIEKHVEGLKLKIISVTNNNIVNDPEPEGEVNLKEMSKFVRAELWSDADPLSFSNPLFF